jgi:hypothetical protein
MDIFRPLHPQYDHHKADLSIASERRLFKLKTFSSADASISSAPAASERQLQRLLLLYRAAFPSASYSILWQTAPLYVANAAIRDARFFRRLREEPGNPLSTIADSPEGESIGSAGPSLAAVSNRATKSQAIDYGWSGAKVGLGTPPPAVSPSSTRPPPTTRRRGSVVKLEGMASSELLRRDVPWRQYLWICLAAYTHLARSYRVVTTIVRGLLAMAVAAEALRGDEAAAIAREVQRQCEEGPEGADMEVESHSLASRADEAHASRAKDIVVGGEPASFVVDLDLAMRDRAAAQVQVVGDRFAELTMFDEFIDADGKADMPDGTDEGGQGTKGKGKAKERRRERRQSHRRRKREEEHVSRQEEGG